MVRKLTALGIVLHATQHDPNLETIVLPKPEIEQKALKLWMKEGINPNRQRKGKSGELPRRG